MSEIRLQVKLRVEHLKGSFEMSALILAGTNGATVHLVLQEWLKNVFRCSLLLEYLGADFLNP